MDIFIFVSGNYQKVVVRRIAVGPKKRLAECRVLPKCRFGVLVRVL